MKSFPSLREIAHLARIDHDDRERCPGKRGDREELIAARADGRKLTTNSAFATSMPTNMRPPQG